MGYNVPSSGAVQTTFFRLRRRLSLPRMGGARNARMASSVMPGKIRITPTYGSRLD